MMMRSLRSTALALSALASTTIGCSGNEAAPHPVSLPADAATEAMAASADAAKTSDAASDRTAVDGGSLDANDDGS
jgi:hypothetical protein